VKPIKGQLIATPFGRNISPTSGATRTPIAPSTPNLKIPTLPAWDGGSQKEEDGVNVFLPRLAQYLETQRVSKEQRPHNVFPFLKGKAFQLWQLEAETLTQDNVELTWEMFAKFMIMKDTFGVIAPEQQARRQYDRLTQAGNVSKYVSETKRLVQLMKPMLMICPGEADIIHNIITKARPPLQEWLREHCPEDYGQVLLQCLRKQSSLALIMTQLYQSSYHSGNRDSNRRSSNQRSNANRTHQPTRRFHTGGWPALCPNSLAQQGEFTMVQAKKHKPAPDMDRPTYKGLVQKAIKDRSITYTAFEQQRMNSGECPCCGKQHLLIGCDPIFGGPFFIKKGIVPP
jgi:hypothetical protein